MSDEIRVGRAPTAAQGVRSAAVPVSAGATAWTVQHSCALYRNRHFTLRRDRCTMPDARMAPDYYVWEMRDWANVVALTAQRELILVRQYRHAAGCHFREFPGGVIEHTHDADAAAAAARELREETGYAPGSLVALGCHYPNPALQDNRLHVFLALDCVQVGAPTPDAGEDLVTELVDLADYLADNNGDAPRHGLMLASWALALPRLREHFPDIAAPA